MIRYDRWDDDTDLMGHRFAGKVVAAVADRAPAKVRKVNCVDAFCPERVREPQGGFDPTRELGEVPEGTMDFTLTERIIDNIGKDVQGSSRQRRMAPSILRPIQLTKGLMPPV